MFRIIDNIALLIDRARTGRDVAPGAAILNSQTIKAPAAHGSGGYDGTERGAVRVLGRQNHIAVDTDGRLLMVNITTAEIAGSAGAQAVLDALYRRQR